MSQSTRTFEFEGVKLVAAAVTVHAVAGVAAEPTGTTPMFQRSLP